MFYTFPDVLRGHKDRLLSGPRNSIAVANGKALRSMAVVKQKVATKKKLFFWGVSRSNKKQVADFNKRERRTVTWRLRALCSDDLYFLVLSLSI